MRFSFTTTLIREKSPISIFIWTLYLIICLIEWRGNRKCVLAEDTGNVEDNKEQHTKRLFVTIF